ncbi:MAG: hypothetical protein HETSPECPRED_002263 [Heterodermia speciosa]|uniref:Uncharacterized protein n=1 Tax=Heterodermia speciosa TaxID=116794 RepID=A0A8H3F2W6_9LECA|nr:MAG: hypothetical protein HETSPECPRED_002263 [Heterodermia speciosa]
MGETSSLSQMLSFAAFHEQLFKHFEVLRADVTTGNDSNVTAIDFDAAQEREQGASDLISTTRTYVYLHFAGDPLRDCPVPAIYDAPKSRVTIHLVF